jgi:methylmalonyl-CoA mutase N-terminal domain/subunit
VVNTVDPLGGSYAIEALTDRIEAEAWEYIRTIDGRGGMLRVIEEGYPQREIGDAAYHYQALVDRNEKSVVGVNGYRTDGDSEPTLLRISDDVERRQCTRVAERKRGRDAARVRVHLAAIRRAAESRENLMPPLVEAVKAECTLGEISDVYRDVFGVYQDPAYV